MQTMTVAGGNLFAIAAGLWGDATQWIRLAQLNNLDDPQLVGVVTLKVPPPQSTNPGGIAAQ